MKNALMLVLICLTVSSCKEDDFTGMYEIVTVKGQLKCAFYPMIRENPLTFGKGEPVKCPDSVFGIRYNEVPAAMNYVRDLQSKACLAFEPMSVQPAQELLHTPASLR